MEDESIEGKSEGEERKWDRRIRKVRVEPEPLRRTSREGGRDRCWGRSGLEKVKIYTYSVVGKEAGQIRSHQRS